jgi:hypothetical protein
MTKSEIRKIALENGFKLKTQPDGSEDLHPYVYDFALALMARSVTGVGYRPLGVLTEPPGDE